MADVTHRTGALSAPQYFIDERDREVVCIAGGWAEVVRRGGLRTLWPGYETYYNLNALREGVGFALLNERFPDAGWEQLHPLAGQPFEDLLELINSCQVKVNAADVRVL